MRKIQLSWGNFYDNNSLTKHDSSQPCRPVLQNNKNSYILKNFKSHTKAMEFFSCIVAGYKLTKKRLHERFFHMNLWNVSKQLFTSYLLEILPVFSTQLQYFSNYT